MKAEELADIYRNCGCKIKKIEGYLFNNQRYINYSFPLLDVIPISKSLINSLKWKYLLSIIFTESRIKNTYEFLLEANNYDLDKFASKIRNRIKKSLKNCTFKKPSLEDLLHFGHKINQQTLHRQSRRDRILYEYKCWEKYITSFYSNENVIILGTYFNDRMVAYIIVYYLAGKYIIQNAFIDKQDSRITAPMNGLIYTMVNQLIEKYGSIKISYGLESFFPLPDLNRFKQNMLFEPLPATRMYIINPLLLPFFKLIIYINVHLFKRKSIKSSFVRRVIRLYQGNRIFIKES